MDNQMKSQHTGQLIKLRTVEETIKANVTVPLDQLEQVNQIFNTFSDLVTAWLHRNTEKLYQVVEELRNWQANGKDQSVGSVNLKLWSCTSKPKAMKTSTNSCSSRTTSNNF